VAGLYIQACDDEHHASGISDPDHRWCGEMQLSRVESGVLLMYGDVASKTVIFLGTFQQSAENLVSKKCGYVLVIS
jgi:hypothetical protein